MYELDEDGHLTCITCGDKIVTVKSHKPFCKGFDGTPWMVLPPNADRVECWKNSPEFRKWAKKNGVTVPA